MSYAQALDAYACRRRVRRRCGGGEVGGTGGLMMIGLGISVAVTGRKD